MMPKTPHLFLRFYINGVPVYATDCDNVKFRLPARRHRLSAAYAARLPAVGGKITA